MHRTILTAATILLFSGTAIFAGDAPAPTTAEQAHKTVNKLSPVSGEPVDAKIAPVELSFTHEGKAKPVMVGVATAAELETINKADAKTKALYAEAAVTHGMVKDGKIEKLKRHERGDKEGKDDRGEKEHGEKHEHEHEHGHGDRPGKPDMPEPVKPEPAK